MGFPSVLTPSKVYSPESISKMPDASTRRDFNAIDRLGTYLKSSAKNSRIAFRPCTGSLKWASAPHLRHTAQPSGRNPLSYKHLTMLHPASLPWTWHHQHHAPSW